MDEISELQSQLETLVDGGWAAQAIVALKSPAMEYAGQKGTPAQSFASDLLRLYEQRLLTSRRDGLEVFGLELFLEKLKRIPQSAVVDVRPFLSPTYSVTAFVDSDHNLIGCVTVKRNNPDLGTKSLKIALGPKK